MNIAYIHSVKNYLFTLQQSKASRWLLMAFLVFNLFLSSTFFAQNGPNCSTGICIGPGGSLTSGSLTVTSDAFYSTFIVKNGETLIVKSGVTLYVGQVGTPVGTQVVDFQNGCTVVIESGASLIVNGLLNNSNHSNGVTFNGAVSVTGNVTGGNGSIISGSGTLNTTGTIITDKSGIIFGSTGECIAGPCSGGNLCSFTGSISSNQTTCTNATPSALTSTTTASSPTYQWQSSTTSGGGFTDVVINGTNATYVFPSALTQTTYYRLKIKSTCTVITNQITIVVNSALINDPPTVTTTQPACTVPTGTITVTAPTGMNYSIDGLTYTNTSRIFTSLAPGTYSVTAKNSSGCISNATSVTINAQPITPVQPTLSIATQPTCSVATGSFTIANYNAAYTYSVNPSTDVIVSGSTITAPTGSYTVTVTLGTCTSLASADVVINAQPQTPLTPIITDFTPPTFANNDGTITLDNLPAGPWVGNQIKDGVIVSPISGPGTPHTITGLSMGSYEFEVVGLCISLKPTPTSLVPVPYIPVVSGTTAITCSGFTANWPATPTATSYLLDVSTVSNFSSFVSGYQDRNVGNVLTFPVTGMSGGTLYYRIRAQNSALISLYSATITVDVPVTLSAATLGITGSPTVCISDTATAIAVVETSGAVIMGRQWGVRSDSGGAITTIEGQTTSPFIPGTALSGFADGTWYVVCTSTSACGGSVVSNEIPITIARPPSPSSIVGVQNQCIGNTSQVYSILPVPGALNYGWVVPLGWTITSGQGTRSITVTIGAASGNVSVNVVSVCGTGSSSLAVTVAAPSYGGIVTPANTDTCFSSPSASLTVTGNTGDIIGWEMSTDNFASYIPIPETDNPFNPFAYIPFYTGVRYFRAVVLNGACGFAYSNAVTVTVNPALLPIIPIIAVDGIPYPSGAGITRCANASAVFSVAPVTNATSYAWVVPTGWTITSTPPFTNSITVTTGNSAQDGVIQVNASNVGCGNTATNTLYMDLILAQAPQVSLIQPTCTVDTGTITVTSPAPAAGITYSVVGINPVVPIITNSTGVFSGLAVGTYDVTVHDASTSISNPSITLPITTFCSTTSTITLTSPNKTWNGSVSSDWNTAANWSPSGVPDNTNCIVIPDIVGTNYDPIISGTNYNALGYSLTVSDLGSLKVNATNTITVTDFVNVGLGFLTFEDTSSLVQINNVVNTGYIDYKRTTTARPSDYTYWSSPVAPMTLGELYPTGSFYSYEATSSSEDWKEESAATDMIAGKGYIANRGAVIPAPGPPPPPDLLEITFAGAPNNGTKSISVFKDKSCLLGNPYPSAIDADTFLAANVGVLNGTLYFWTHNTQIGVGVSNPGTGVYAYSGDDYAVYNATGGVGAAPPDVDLDGNPYPSTVPTGNIGAGQGFFATSIADGTVNFTNAMRRDNSGNSYDNSQFYKKRNSKTGKVIEKNRIWLNLTNTQGAFKQALIGYITDATNEYDERFDGESYDGNEFVDFYSLNQDKNLVIQGRALPFDENDEVPLGYRTTINGAFTINIDQADGSLTNQAVYIEDKLTKTVTDLKSGNYTFNTVAGTFDDRLVLKYKNSSDEKNLGTPTTNTPTNAVLVSNTNKQIKINSYAETMDKVAIYDLLGRQIYKNDKVDANELSITNLVSSRQVVLVKTTLKNGITTTDKIVF